MLASLLKHLPPPGSKLTSDQLLDSFLSFCTENNTVLYPAQEEAVLELFAGKNVILSTPTGSGKSLVAMALLFKALAEDDTAFYTAPIKALVNEKFFDLCQVLGAANVGLMTGDASVNSDAPVVCATAEILANLALRQGRRLDAGYVVMDEFHFYSDRERGMAWQVPLLTLPQTRFLLMSATLGDTRFFEEEMTKLNGAETVRVHSEDRPVPLEFTYRDDALHETIADLLKLDRAPIYVVHFTQRDATEHAQELMSIDFLTKEEKLAIKDAISKRRFDTAFGQDLKKWLLHGVGVHHAGLLPKYRIIVERLARRGLLKIICGTDTLGVGVNVPIRSVLFTKLCKYDGAKTTILSVRDFKQIAGRAGRKGFDARGYVVAQAPEHVCENKKILAKAEGDAKKSKKLHLRKPPERGYVHFDEETFKRLINGQSEPLQSRFEVNTSFVLSAIARQNEEDSVPREGCTTLRQTIKGSHETKQQKRVHGRRAVQILRSLRQANLISADPRGLRVAADLQQDFSLNHALSLYVVEALAACNRDSESYPLDILSLVEAVIESPAIILQRQLDELKTQAMNTMKSEGVEYEERMAELEKIENPKPNAEWMYETFGIFKSHHPWVEGLGGLRPKSIAREMWEVGVNFNEYIRDLGLKRSEGVLLRYLMEAYKALSQTIPEEAKTEAVLDLEEWLGSIVRNVDSSLLDEWENLLHPDQIEAKLKRIEADEDNDDITRNIRGFRVLVRNAVWQFVLSVARGQWGRAADLIASERSLRPEDLAAGFEPYFAEYEYVKTDASARANKNTILEEGDDEWFVIQTLVDPEDNSDFTIRFRVNLQRSRELGRPALVSVELTS